MTAGNSRASTPTAASSTSSTPSTYFGVFIIRRDGRIYVPAAFQKSSTGWVSFGDNWTRGYTSSTGQTNSVNKIPQMTVSPDGRFGAFKLRTSTSYNQYETADTTAILLISLTGERISAWGDEVYKIIDTGSNGSSSSRASTSSPRA